MKINITVKQIGSKQPFIQNNQIDIEYDKFSIDAKTLLELIVKNQVEKFNSSSFEKEDLDKTKKPNSSYEAILSLTGKAGFGAVYNQKRVDIEEAQSNVLLAFEDGLFAFFYGEDELSLDSMIDLSANKVLIFIRLTFLAGSIW